MSIDDGLEQVEALQNQTTRRLIERVDREGLSYPIDFERRLRDGSKTNCWWTAMYLLGLSQNPVIQEARGKILINTEDVERFLLRQRTGEKVVDDELLRRINTNQPVNVARCPLVLIADTKRQTSVHWAVTDPKNPTMIYQTTDMRQPLVHAPLKQMIETGNFGFLSSLKAAKGEWTIHFCR